MYKPNSPTLENRLQLGVIFYKSTPPESNARIDSADSQIRVYTRHRAILVTTNLEVYGASKKGGKLTPLYEADGKKADGKTPMYLHGIDGEIPVYVTDGTKGIRRIRPSDLTIVDLTSLPLDTPELEAVVDAIAKNKVGPVVGVGRTVVYFPGHPLNGYSVVDLNQILKRLRQANKDKPTIN